MAATVQVGGSLHHPSFRDVRKLGIILGLLAPLAWASRALEAGPGVGHNPMHWPVRVLGRVGPLPLLGLASAALLAGQVARARLLRDRVDLELVEGGFAQIDRRRRVEYREDRVVAIGHDDRPSGVDDLRRGLATIEVDGPAGRARVRLDWRYRRGEGDPLALWLDRLDAACLARATRAIDHGGQVERDGWGLDRAGLQRGPGLDRLAFEDVAVAAILDGELKVWRRGEARPWLRLPAGTEHARALRSILEARKPPGPPAEVAGLGRPLLRRWAARVGWVHAANLIVVWSALLFGVASLPDPGPLAPRARIGLVACLAGCVILEVVRLSRFVEIHGRGVVRRGPIGSRPIPFADLDRVEVRPASKYGFVRVAFRPARGRGRRRIDLFVPANGEALEVIRGLVPALIRER